MPPSPALNAQDEQAWLDRAMASRITRPCWRLAPYMEAAVVLGRSQSHMASLLGARARLPVLTRRCGGGAVLVGPWMLGLSIILPNDHPVTNSGPMASYRWLGQLFVSVLAQMQIQAESISPDRLKALAQGESANVLRPGWACFGGLSPWEVVVDARKLVGLAQSRGQNGVLLVAGLLLSPVPWPMLCEIMGRGAHEASALGRLTCNCEQLRTAPLHAAALAELGAQIEHRLALGLNCPRQAALAG